MQTISLHGNAILYSGYGIMIVGKHGYGKSTLTHEFVNLGAKLISDDLVKLVIMQHQIYLCQDSSNFRNPENSVNKLDLIIYLSRKITNPQKIIKDIEELKLGDNINELSFQDIYDDVPMKWLGEFCYLKCKVMKY